MKDNNELKVILENIIKKQHVIEENIFMKHVTDKILPVAEKNAANINVDFKDDIKEIFKIKNVSQLVEYLTELMSGITNSKGETVIFDKEELSTYKSKMQGASVSEILKMSSLLSAYIFKQLSEKQQVTVLKESLEVTEEFIYYNEGVSRGISGIVGDIGKSIKQKITSLQMTKKQMLLGLALAVFFGGSIVTKAFADTPIAEIIKKAFTTDVKDDTKFSDSNIKLFGDKIAEISKEAEEAEKELPNVPGVAEKETLQKALKTQVSTLDPSSKEVTVLNDAIKKYEDEKLELQKELRNEINDLENSAEIGTAVVEVAQFNEKDYLINVKDNVISGLKSKNLKNIEASYDSNNKELETLSKLRENIMSKKINSLGIKDQYAKIQNNQGELDKEISSYLKAQGFLKEFFDKLDRLDDNNYNTVLPGFSEELMLKCAIAGTLDENFNPIDCTTLSKTGKDKDGNVILEPVPNKEVTKVTFDPKNIDVGYQKAIVEMNNFPGFNELVNFVRPKILLDKDGKTPSLTDDDLKNFEKRIKNVAKSNKKKLSKTKIQNLVFSKIILERINAINGANVAKAQKNKDDKISTYLSSIDVLRSLVSEKDGKLSVDLNSAPEKVRLALGLSNNSVTKGDVKTAFSSVQQNLLDQLSKENSTSGGVFTKGKTVEAKITFIGESTKKDLSGLISVIEENYLKRS